MSCYKNMKMNSVILTIVSIIFYTSGFAQKVDLSEEAYIQPPKEIVDIATAPSH